MTTSPASAAVTAQATLNAALLPAATIVQEAMAAFATAIAPAQAIVAGCSPCRTVNLVNNVAGFVTGYTVEAAGCVAELTPAAGSAPPT